MQDAVGVGHVGVDSQTPEEYYATPAEYVDRLTTIEMRNRGQVHGVMHKLYAAARSEGGGRPLSLRAAEAILEHVGPDTDVVIVTGAGTPPLLPKGENDGPVGAAVLARAIRRGIGATPIFVVEERQVDPMVAASEAAGLTIVAHQIARERRWGAALVTAPSAQSEVQEWAAAFFDTYKPKVIISIERLGPNEKGIVHGGGGARIWEVPIDLSPLLAQAGLRGVVSIGIGDAGNEMGFGRIHSQVQSIHPYGRRCKCPCESGIAAVAKTDVLVVGAISNWAAYGIEAMLAIMLGKVDLQHTPQMQDRILHACIDAGGLEPRWCSKEFLVDWTDGESSVSVVQLLGNLVRMALAEPAVSLIANTVRHAVR